MSRWRDLAEKRRQRVVEPRLVRRVRVEGEAAVLSGRQDGPRGRCEVGSWSRVDGGENDRRRCDERREKRDEAAEHVPMVQPRRVTTVHSVDALLAFGAALVALRLSGDLVRRWRTRRRPELAAWAVGLAAYAVAAGALAWGAAAGWSDAAFRVYYLGGALLTAALLGVGSLLLVGRRWVTPVALVYTGLAIGVAIAVPLRRPASRARRSPRRKTCSTCGLHACSRSSATRSARSR